MEWAELFEGIPGRVFQGSFHGDTADEIELAALEEAEHVFGPGVPLAVVPCYQVYWAPVADQEVHGKRYSAAITVLAKNSAPV
jgi:hypothetical protein